MSSGLEFSVREAVRQLAPGARDIAIVAESDAGAARGVRVSWEQDGVTHLHQLVVKLDPGLRSPTGDLGESRLLRSLEETMVPAPRVLRAEPADPEPLLILEHIPGRPLLDALSAAGMRWELSAMAFSYARTLATIHALEWTVAAPWLADRESLPEDLVEEQVDAMWADWTERLPIAPASGRRLLERALAWLDRRRPVRVSVCLCHGDYDLTNVLVGEDGEVSGVVDWNLARVTDASYDLALIPLLARRAGLAAEDADLFSQAVLGAYLQASPRSLGNLPFFTVARLLSGALDAFARPRGAKDPDAADTGDLRWAEPEEWLTAIEQAMRDAGRVPWRA